VPLIVRGERATALVIVLSGRETPMAWHIMSSKVVIVEQLRRLLCFFNDLRMRVTLLV
jgi:hypothetical protein